MVSMAPLGSQGAHPRVSGEHAVGENIGADTVGSSPRERGKQLTVYECNFEVRLIPA